MSVLAFAPRLQYLDADGTPRSGALANFYVTSTTTRANTYSDSALTIPHANPVVQLAAGYFPPIYLDPAVTYKLVLTDSVGGNAVTVDPVNSALTAADLLALINARTAAEIAASITPTSYLYPEADVRRYGADPTGTTDSDTAFASAEAVAYAGALGKMYAPAGTYSLTGSLTLRSGVSLIGDGSGSSEYYPSSPWSSVRATKLWRKSSGGTGPVLIIQTADQVRGVWVQFDKVGGAATGAIQVGTATAAANIDSTYNAEFESVSVFGPAISGASLVDASCVGVYFYDGSIANSVQRYGNRFRGLRIVNFYTAIRLGKNCNANNFTGVVIRQCYQNFVLDGGTEGNCLENTFAGLSLFNIGLLPQTALTATGAPASGAVSATLTGNWSLATGDYGVLFSNGDVRLVTLTNGATTATWRIPLTSAATTALTANISIVFILRNAAMNNNFTGYATENNGVAFYIEGPTTISFTANLAAAATSGTLATAWPFLSGGYPVQFSNGETKTVTFTNGATSASWTGGLTSICLLAATLQGCTGNTFVGHENEAYASVVPPQNFHTEWTQPINRTTVSQMLAPAVATPLGYTNGTGNSVRLVQTIGGTLPQLNAGAATLVAADANCKVFARFNSTVMSKTVRPSFRARLTVALNAPGGGVGDALTTVEFWYRPTDNSTNAGQLAVIAVSQRPSASNYIRGLHFLTGVNSALGFGLAIVGGNVGASLATRFLVELELLAMTYSVNVVDMRQYAQVSWGCIAATANDVADAISLLSVADTAV